jgi:cytochrome P450
MPRLASLYDPSSPTFQDHVYEIYRTLRDDHPVYESEEHGWWALSRFEDVREAANDPATLSSENTSIATGLLPMIQSVDPPYHDQLRSLVNTAFTRSRMGAMEPRIREIARDLIDRFAGVGKCDLLLDYARHLPSLVIGEMIGVPPDRREVFLECSEAMVAIDPGESQGGKNLRSAERIYQEFATLLEERKRHPREDLMSALIEAELDGRRLTQEELLGFCFVLIVAGNDTTTNLIANGAVLLSKHPDQRRRLAAEPHRMENAVDEMLRYDSPAQALPRIATRDVTLHGRTIPKGAEVKLVWGSANHDEREFEDPDRFDIDRVITRHLGFGQGAHYCLGAKLARLEARVGLQELLARIPEYKLDAEPRWQTSVWARAYSSVPVSF